MSIWICRKAQMKIMRALWDLMRLFGAARKHDVRTWEESPSESRVFSDSCKLLLSSPGGEDISGRPKSKVSQYVRMLFWVMFKTSLQHPRI